MNEQQYLSASEVAKRLGITRQMVYKMALRGEFLGGVFFGRAHRWNANAVDAWAEQQKERKFTSGRQAVREG